MKKQRRTTQGYACAGTPSQTSKGKTTQELKRKIKSILNDWIHTQAVGPGLSKPPVDQLLALIYEEKEKSAIKTRYDEFIKKEQAEKECGCGEGMMCLKCATGVKTETQEVNNLRRIKELEEIVRKNKELESIPPQPKDATYKGIKNVLEHPERIKERIDKAQLKECGKPQQKDKDVAVSKNTATKKDEGEWEFEVDTIFYTTASSRELKSFISKLLSSQEKRITHEQYEKGYQAARDRYRAREKELEERIRKDLVEKAKEWIYRHNKKPNNDRYGITVKEEKELLQIIKGE